MADSMKYRQLGKSDLHISTVAFGCMSLKDEYAAIEKMLNKAYEGGINYFDTADIYDGGQNEVIVGKALRAIRKKIILATKGGNEANPNGDGWKWNPSKAYILKACEDSLKRLKTDYIDLYQLHGGTIEDPIDETIEAFEILQQQGKIRYYGISSIRPNVINEYMLRSNIVSVMMQYSLLDRRPEETCLPLLEKHKIGVLARGTIAGGLLAGKPPKEYLGYTKEQVEGLSNAVAKKSGEERTHVQTSLHYVLNNPAISAAVVGIGTNAQLFEAMNLWQSPHLTKSEIEELNYILPVNIYNDHGIK